MKSINLSAAAGEASGLPPLGTPEIRPNFSKSIPSAEQLADPENIVALAWKTHKAMAELGLSEATIRHYTVEGLSAILKRHYDVGENRLSATILDELVGEKRIKYENGQISRTPYQNLRKAAWWIREMHLTGSITQGKVPAWGQREAASPFAALLQDFCSEAACTLAESSCKTARSAIRRFLLEMEDHGFMSPADLTQANVNNCLTSFAQHYTSGLNCALFSVRMFLRFLYAKNVTPVDLCQSLPEFVASRNTFHEPFSEGELDRLLAQPDRATPLGKRNYAMMVLATQSGLRACDIVRLSLCNIDWRTREIRLTQHKTGQPLALPLEPESGNAVADYILNGRPKSALQNVFLCHCGVPRPIAARSVSAIVSKYMKEACIPARHRAFHALRRSFGTTLLHNDVPFEMIQQLLGHSDMNSMKPYLSIDEQGLKQCALSLLSNGKAGD